ncbi:hypothetical protein P691DRAFT_669516, partial [Macrolepiota fuliginosa MF-IS2]
DLYYLAFPKDRWQVKLIVYFVYVVGTIQTAFALQDFYALFCTPTLREDLHVFGFTWFTIPVSGALVAVVAQLFYAYRIYTLSRSKLVTAIVSMLAVSQFISGIFSAATTDNQQVITPGAGVEVLLPFISAWGIIGVICDIVIAAYMFHFLSRQLARASRRTQVPLTKIKRLLLETGILTGASLSADQAFTFRADQAFMIPGLSLSKLYGNSILVLLNNRFTISGGRNTPHPDFDIASYSCPDATGESQGPVAPGIAFTHANPTETAISDHSGGIHAINLTPPSRWVSEESSEIINRGEKNTQEN